MLLTYDNEYINWWSTTSEVISEAQIKPYWDVSTQSLILIGYKCRLITDDEEQS